MQEYFLNHEGVIRGSFFLATLLLMGFWEHLSPKRNLTTTRTRRWFANLGIVVVDSIIVRILLPVLPVAFAIEIQSHGIGLINLVSLPSWLGILLAIIIMDMVVYWQHVIFHRVPIFWRLHKVHHTDMDLDVTSGNRFHPIEILLSLFLKLVTVVVLGPSPLAVMLFEIILNAMAQFNHSNVEIGNSLDNVLRRFIVTPDVHRIHHSVVESETNANYGFNLSIWDRLFGTYKAQPDKGHEGMTIGLADYRNEMDLNLLGLITIPFKKSPKFPMD